MNSNSPLQQKDLFSAGTAGVKRIVLRLEKLQAPRRLNQEQKDQKDRRPLPPNYHIPSFKNSKRWVTKLPNGKPLKRPLLITSPEYQEWMEKAAASLESQLLSMCQTDTGETQLVRSKLFAMLSLLPADDSVNDLPEGSWKVERVAPGSEGATIVIERLN